MRNQSALEYLTINDQTTAILISLLVYKVLLIGIGLWASRRVHNQADFLLGGRKLGAWVAGLSYAASTSSAWVLLGFTGFVFTYGASALWILPGILGGHIIMWTWFGPRIRRESGEQNWLTPTEFLSANTNTKDRTRIASLAAALIAFCFVFYIAAQFDAAATAFTTNFQMNSASALILSAVIILVYCLLGGFWAASVTDTLQGIVMLIAAVMLPLLAVIEAGGPVQIFSQLSAMDAGLGDWRGGFGGFLLLGFIGGTMGIGLGTLGQPHLLARLMAVKGERERKQGFAIVMIWAVFVYFGMAALALATRSLSIQPGSGEQIFYLMAETLLPPILAGVIIAAILSAVMSTVDSLLLAASAALSHDLGLARRFRIDPLWTSRFVMTAVVIAAVTLALTLSDTIFNRVLFAWSGLGAAFGPLIAARVMGREPCVSARLGSILAGFSLTALFYTLGSMTANPDSSQFLRYLIDLAHLPGDPFERILPFAVSLAIVFVAPQLKRN